MVDLISKINEHVVRTKTFADTMALTMLNTPVESAIELGVAGMSPHDSADLRFVMALTNPILGRVRDYIKKKAHLKQDNDESKRRLIDMALGAGYGLVELGSGIGKIAVTRWVKGQPYDLKDFYAGLCSAVYSMLSGDLAGIIMDTYRDGIGLDIECKRSLFPKDMKPEVKKTISYMGSAATMLGIGAYYNLTR